MNDMQYAVMIGAAVLTAIAIILGFIFRPAKAIRRAPTEVISERRFEIRHHPTGDRRTLRAIFWIWGLGYGLLNLLSLVEASRMTTLGVGTSAAVTMHICMWMGGLLLFGIGALLCDTSSTMRIHDPAPPEERG